MLNMIKMDLYRMVRTKSMYVVWIVMAAAIFFSTSMSKLDIDTMNKEAEQQQTESIAETVKPETINMGMSVFLPTQPGEKVTVFDQVYANLQAKFVALFLVIFTVLFSSADIGSGYIKNIGGQVRSRRNLIFSKASVLFVYTTVTMLFMNGNEQGIQRIFQNIIKNGLDHGEKKISISLEEVENNIRIQIKNQVCHVEKINVDQVFERFYKADEARSKTSSGLGLSIAKELVLRMDGKISARIEGNEFCVEIVFPK
jgi:signal transduction histidine kinase